MHYFIFYGDCYSDFGTSFYNFCSTLLGTSAMAGRVLWIKVCLSISLRHLMCAIAPVPLVWWMWKKHLSLLLMTPIVWDIETKNLKERTKTSDLIVYHVYLTFFNLSLAWILYFHVWLQKKVKFLIWSENCSQFDIYQAFCLSLSESSQSNLSISNLIQNSVKHKIVLWK